jgi:hypothetical protein
MDKGLCLLNGEEWSILNRIKDHEVHRQKKSWQGMGSLCKNVNIPKQNLYFLALYYWILGWKLTCPDIF